VRAAELESQIAAENVRSVEQNVNLQVWTSYFTLQTATQRLGTARDLLASAQESADVAQSRYRAGVGSILDLLTAESALENARAQEVQARADWFVAVAQLAHDTGSLR
jgi:outer membrane protein TolC